MTWDEFFSKTEEFVGADFELQEGNDVYRGPIAAISRTDDVYTISLQWCAQLNKPEAQWENFPEHQPLRYSTDVSTIQSIGEGRILIQMLGLGMAVIFPRGGSKLDPARVKG